MAAPSPVGDGVGSSSPGGDDASADAETTVPLPWHFKLLVAAIALYLGWRAVQGVEWVTRQF